MSTDKTSKDYDLIIPITFNNSTRQYRESPKAGSYSFNFEVDEGTDFDKAARSTVYTLRDKLLLENEDVDTND